MRWLLIFVLGCASPASAQYGADPRIDQREIPLERYIPEMFRFVGPVRVIDGDTIEMQTQKITDYDGNERGGINEPLRLLGIDAPERGEPGAAAATAMLRELIGLSLTVRCICMPDERSDRPGACLYDRYGRVIVRCGTEMAGTPRTGDIGQEMIRRGFARARYGCHYAAEHREACQARRGLWAGFSGDCEPACAWRQ